jgi:glycosylphosphatidylinositol transamidase
MTIFHSFQVFIVDVVGLNGRLPNADLVTTVVRSLQYSGIPVTIHDGEQVPFGVWIDRYPILMRNLWSFVKIQAFGVTTHAHSLFSKYNIEALSLVGVQGSRFGLSTIGLGLETLARSLNNLLEKFHHAYWYYFMPTAYSFIPISKYIIPIAIIAGCAIFVSLDLWWTSGEIAVQPVKDTTRKAWRYAQRQFGVGSFSNKHRPLYIPLLLLCMCFVLPIWVFTNLKVIIGMSSMGLQEVSIIN